MTIVTVTFFLQFFKNVFLSTTLLQGPPMELFQHLPTTKSFSLFIQQEYRDTEE